MGVFQEPKGIPPKREVEHEIQRRRYLEYFLQDKERFV
jgi:hypothetical protein